MTRSDELQSFDLREPQRLRRGPAVPVALCFALGIALDRWQEIPWEAWLLTLWVLAICWLVLHCRKQDGRATVVLLACCACVGGARHHQLWSVGQSDDVSLFATEQAQPVRLVGILTTEPQIRVREPDSFRSAMPQFDKTNCVLECRSLLDDNGDHSVSGSVCLSVTGHLLHAQIGDEVEVCGSLSRPRGPRNPGEFDYRNYLRSQGLRCVVYAYSPDAVRRLSRGRKMGFQRWAGRLRRESEFLFIKHLSRDRVPLALALMLGNRLQMDDDMSAAFAESGTIHVLAISGLHVGILAGLLWFCCRMFSFSMATTSAVLIVGVIGYALITNGRPPVVRASIFVFLVAVGGPWYRQSTMENTLALSALLILAWHPADLFNVGAQLSFLAVMAIIWSSSRMRDHNSDRSSLDAASFREGWFRKQRSQSWKWLKHGYVMTAAIWLFTVPLVAARFHLISPVGLVINVFLIPLVMLVLWLGYGFLLCGFLIPQLAAVLGFGFDQGLGLLVGVVQAAAHFEMSHRYVPGPPGWWLVGYYALLAAAVSLSPRWRFKRWGWAGVCAWIVFGLSVGLVPAKQNGLRCTFLSVGHGCSILVELPNGNRMPPNAETAKTTCFIV